ncbi:MAG: MarR family transcriptional regulator [Pseudomonadota bacterium]
MADSYEIAKNMDRLMRRIDAASHKRASALDTDKIGQLGGLVLLAIAELHPVTMQDLVRHVGRDKSQMTRLVQMMESRGVIARTPSPTDGRVTLLHPTEKGCAFVATIRALMSDVMDEVLAPLTAKDRATFDRILRDIWGS